MRHSKHKTHSTRLIAIASQRILLLVIGLLAVHHVFAQSKPAGASTSPLCSRANALNMIKQQADLTKTFNDPVRRIAVLLRAAELLWPYEQDKARAVFTEAFDLAGETEKENERKNSRSLLLRLRVPDQRFVVVRAVARKDAVWAKDLTQQILKASSDGETPSSSRSSFESSVIAARLLDSATKMIATDVNAAFDLARVSFNYPAGSWLTQFLYKLAEVNQQAADQFYAQALGVYGDRPMREFLYLQAYPFAWRETNNTPVFSFYQVPAKFVTNQSLQRRFVQVLLRRAQQAVEGPVDEGDVYQSSAANLLPGKVHLLVGLTLVEPQVKSELPDLLPQLTDAREKILVSLPVETQRLLLQPGREISVTKDQTFDEQLESAQKASDVHERDGLIATAVIGSEKESLADVLQAIDKISDAELRGHLLEWVYFHRAVASVKDREFEEAERLASKVDGLEQRGYLHTEIAKGLLSRSETQTHGREVLDEAISEAKKAGVTIFAARTLLTASNLYAKIDLNRSIAILADAINSINRIESPDFESDDQALQKTPERKGRGGRYQGEYQLRFYMPGIDPQSAFRELAKFDFDTALSQSSALTDKFQRAMSTLSLADVCLGQVQQQTKEKSKKIASP
ncbi:MAG TPA: hypothetical protein VFZ22_23940 [Pyrinomonadaceae bacterium]|nr:hypothetical protein [Pyrinomonadaceae bacterium]